jgi:hypothetical protein
VIVGLRAGVWLVGMFRVGSRETITSDPSQLDPYVRVTQHTAPDNLGFRPAIHELRGSAIIWESQAFSPIAL